MNIFYSILTALAGLGVSLYGFNVLRQGMETSLGNGFKRMIGKVSKRRFRSYFVSAGVTGAWQSTTLTLSMITGFLNVGNITLTQGINLMLGVGLGSSLAILLLVFQSIDLMKILSVLCVVGAFMLMFNKSHKTHRVAESVMGFGLLFAGISLLGDGMNFLTQNEAVFNFISTLTNPVVLVCVGGVLSILTNSMYATVTIITALVGISGGGPLDVLSGVYMLIGATVVGGVMPIFFCINNSSKESKAMLLGYNVFKIFAGILMGLSLFVVAPSVIYQALGSQTALFIVLYYVTFSFVASLLLLLVSKPFGKLLFHMVPNRKHAESVYDSFIADENTFKVFEVTLPWLMQNVAKIVSMETKLTNKILKRFEEKLFVDRGLNNEIKGLDKIIRLTNNNAIRFSASLNDVQLEKINIVVNILGDANHILQRCKRLLELGQEHKLKPHKLTKEQLENIQKLWNKIEQATNGLEDLIMSASQDLKHVDNVALVKILAQTKKNEALNSNIRKNLFIQQKYSGDLGLYFNILLALENINTDILNITIKTGILPN